MTSTNKNGRHVNVMSKNIAAVAKMSAVMDQILDVRTNNTTAAVVAKTIANSNLTLFTNAVIAIIRTVVPRIFHLGLHPYFGRHGFPTPNIMVHVMRIVSGNRPSEIIREQVSVLGPIRN